jgi:hypothetical protein
VQAENQKGRLKSCLGFQTTFFGFIARISESGLLLFKQKRFNRRYSREGEDTLSIWATVFQIPVSQDFRRIPAGA